MKNLLGTLSAILLALAIVVGVVWAGGRVLTVYRAHHPSTCTYHFPGTYTGTKTIPNPNFFGCPATHFFPAGS